MRSGWASRFLRNLAFGFRRELRPYERDVLEATLRVVTPADARALRLQLDDRERVQRWNADRMLLFGFAPGDNAAPISSLAENHCLATVKLGGADTRLAARIMTHKGRLSSVEFSKPPRAILAGGYQVISAKLDGKSRGHAPEIDAEEHGDGGDA